MFRLAAIATASILGLAACNGTDCDEDGKVTREAYMSQSNFLRFCEEDEVLSFVPGNLEGVECIHFEDADATHNDN